MRKLKESILGGDEEQRDCLLDDDESEGLCSLTQMQVPGKSGTWICDLIWIYDNLVCLLAGQRIYGFAGCLLGGLVCMILSMIVFVKPIKFALLFTFGNLLAVGSTAFLLGYGKQLQMMFDPGRVYPTSIYIGCVVLAFICALWIHSKLLTVLAIICEICALIW